MTVQMYAMVQDGTIVNIVMWDGNSDTNTGGWPVPDGVTMVVIPRCPGVGDIATQNADGSWTFTAPN